MKSHSLNQNSTEVAERVSSTNPEMTTSSHTPLLAEVNNDGAAPPVDDEMTDVQRDRSDMSVRPSTQATVNSRQQLLPTSRMKETGHDQLDELIKVRVDREAAGAPLAKISFCDGSTESVDIRRCTAEHVTKCMCCEDGCDQDPRGAATARSDGTPNPRTVPFQKGAAASTGAAAGKPINEPSPRLEASQSLPSILPHATSEHTRRQSHHQSPPRGARLPSDSRESDRDSSSVRHPRITGIVSDSMLSLPTGDICRICHTGRRHEPLMGPCLCAGSMRYTHQVCLTTWLAQSGRSRCELCGYKFKTKMVGSRNIFQWKVLHLTLIDKLHLAVFALALFLFSGTTAYITWAATESDAMSSVDPASLATQILLPVYCSLSFVSFGLVIYETKSTCVRLVRRWRALNMGLQIVEREPDDDGDGGGGGGSSPTLSGLEMGAVSGSHRGGTLVGQVGALGESRPESTRLGADDVPSDDWSVWSESRAPGDADARIPCLLAAKHDEEESVIQSNVKVNKDN